MFAESELLLVFFAGGTRKFELSSLNTVASPSVLHGSLRITGLELQMQGLSSFFHFCFCFGLGCGVLLFSKKRNLACVCVFFFLLL